MRKRARVRALLGALAVLVLVVSAAGCGLVSDQDKQDLKKKVEARGKQVEQDVRKKVEAKGKQARQNVRKKVEAGGQQARQQVKKEVESSKEELKKKVDDLKK